LDHDRILTAAAAATQAGGRSASPPSAQVERGRCPHDFYSNGDYWWPNPKTTNGLPYVQDATRQTNPENFTAHRQIIRQLSDAIAALGAAYKLTAMRSTH